MNKVLIVAYYWGTRIPGLLKYLPEFGFEPIVLTAPIGENREARSGSPDNLESKHRIIETETYQPKEDVREHALKRFNLASKKSYRYIKPLLRIIYRFYSEIFHYPDKEKEWRHFAIEAGSRIIENENVYAIISSSSPVTCHIVARALKNRYKIPWIADLRDLWTQNHNYPYSVLRQITERRLEVGTLKYADALVTTSWPWAAKLKDLHKMEDVYVITNGFDPERLNEKETALTSKFTITYTGQIYTGKQDPSKLFFALRDLIDGGNIEPEDVEVRFYGPERDVLTRGIEKYRLASVVKEYGVVTRQAALQKQRESHLLLLLNWDDPNEKGVYTLKVFEYLASRRPIISTGGFGNDVVEALLKETQAGVYCKTVEDIKSALKVFYSEYKNSRTVNYTGGINKINKYNHRELARKFTTFLEQVHPAD